MVKSSFETESKLCFRKKHRATTAGVLERRFGENLIITDSK
jgi:hypothetical protein